ncbi:CHASE2 domain-containing protein [candidate division KSB1 bacterium]|nr:CHASE2 domain-containing protein [candidate division KSB1 bacterium]
MPQHSEEKYYGFRRLVIVLVIILLVTLSFQYLALIQSVELQLLDFYQAITGEKSASPDVVLIKVDDSTVAEYGFPLPRARYAELISRLNKYGAQAIAFDLLFNDRTNYQNDSALVHSADNAANVVITFDLGVWSGEQSYEIDTTSCHKNRYSQYALKSPPKFSSDIYRASTAIFPHPDFLDFFNSAGHISLIQDADGHFRKIPLVIYYKGCYYPAFAFKSLCDYYGIAPDEIDINRSIWGDRLLLNAGNRLIEIPVNEKGQALLNYYGDLSQFQTHSMRDVLQNAVHPDEFKDKIVLIGVTVTGDRDSYVTPFSADFPGPGIHATFISNILNGDSIREAPHILNLVISFVLCGVVAFFPYRRYRSLMFLIIFPFLWMLSIAVLGFVALNFSGLWIKAGQIGAAVLLSFTSVILLEKLGTRKYLEFVKSNLRETQLLLKEKDTEIYLLENQHRILLQQFNNMKLLKDSVENAPNDKPADIEELLRSIHESQRNLHGDIEKHLQETENLKRQFTEERAALEDQITNLLDRKNKVTAENPGTFRKIQLFVNNREIEIIGENGSSGRIYFSPVQMALLYYLATARKQGQEWIIKGKITNINQAKKASDKCGHRGIVGCKYWGQKKMEWVDEINENDYEPDPNFIRRYAMEINEKISNNVSTDTKLIRTPDESRDGKYFLVESIQEVHFC